MCFSATTSFATGAILILTGIYSLGKAYLGNKLYLALAVFPLLFGMQEVIEGGLWLALEQSVDLNIENIVYVGESGNVLSV